MSARPEILRNRWWPGSVLALAAIVLAQAAAEAVPAFARKYQTSCQTCHIVFPKLNAFGKAFRLNGYRMPNETEEMVKEKQVSLGAPAYKKLWPQAIWPGAISSARAARGQHQARRRQHAPPSTRTGRSTSVNNDFQFPQELNIFAGGTLGDHVSYLSRGDLRREPRRLGLDRGRARPHRVRLAVRDPRTSSTSASASSRRTWWTASRRCGSSTDAGIDSLFNYNPIGLPRRRRASARTTVNPQPISFPALVRGHRGLRDRQAPGAVGGGRRQRHLAATGRFDGNNAKDFYARLDYKFGGMGLDGDTGGKEAPGQELARRLGARRRLRLPGRRPGASTSHSPTAAHRSTSRTTTSCAPASSRAPIWRTSTCSARTSTARTRCTCSTGTAGASWRDRADLHSWFIQADYVFYPWLHGAVRYETVTRATASVPSLRTGVFNVSALVRANIKAMVEYQRDLREGEEPLAERAPALRLLTGARAPSRALRRISHEATSTVRGPGRESLCGRPLRVLATVATAAADGSITGTVKATGLASNADAVVYVQQVPGTSKPPGPARDDGPAADAVHPARAAGRRRHDGEVPEQRSHAAQRVLARQREVQPRHLAAGAVQGLRPSPSARSSPASTRSCAACTRRWKASSSCCRTPTSPCPTRKGTSRSTTCRRGSTRSPSGTRSSRRSRSR